MRKDRSCRRTKIPCSGSRKTGASGETCNLLIRTTEKNVPQLEILNPRFTTHTLLIGLTLYRTQAQVCLVLSSILLPTPRPDVEVLGLPHPTILFTTKKG
ncbi:hypothetical protein SLE2022_373970 [Rubroshorea leprosula]